MYRRLECTARCDQVVYDDNAHTRRDVLAVHLDLRRAVFEVIRDARGRARQLAALADRNKGLVQIVCHRHAEQEAPRLQSDDRIEFRIPDLRRHLIYRQPQPVRVLEYARDITEDDAGLRVVRDARDILLHLAHRFSCLLPGPGSVPVRSFFRRPHQGRTAQIYCIKFPIGCK